MRKEIHQQKVITVVRLNFTYTFPLCSYNPRLAYQSSLSHRKQGFLLFLAWRPQCMTIIYIQAPARTSGWTLTTLAVDVILTLLSSDHLFTTDTWKTSENRWHKIGKHPRGFTLWPDWGRQKSPLFVQSESIVWYWELSMTNVNPCMLH